MAVGHIMGRLLKKTRAKGAHAGGSKGSLFHVSGGVPWPNHGGSALSQLGFWVIGTTL